jgi:hypothetical protein
MKVLCILIRCTYDKNLEMIQPLVEELPKHRTEIWSVRSGDLGVHMYKVSCQ